MPDERDTAVSGRLESVERRIDVNTDRISRLEKDIDGLRDDIGLVRQEMDRGFSEMRTTLATLGRDMLQALPPWAAQALERKALMVAAFAAAFAAVAGALVAVLARF